MSHSNLPQDEWERLKSELLSLRAHEQSIWGNVDDVLLARYIAGECDSDEANRVQMAATEFPAISEAIDVVSSAVHQCGSHKTNAGAASVVAVSSKSTLGAVGPSKDSELTQLTIAIDLLASTRKWIGFSVSTAVAAGIVALAISTTAIFQSKHQYAQLLALHEANSYRRDLRPQIGEVNTIEQHSGTERDASAKEIWKVVQPNDSAEKNLSRLRDISPEETQKEIDKFSESGYSAAEILAYFKIRLGINPQ